MLIMAKIMQFGGLITEYNTEQEVVVCIIEYIMTYCIISP